MGCISYLGRPSDTTGQATGKPHFQNYSCFDLELLAHLVEFGRGPKFVPERPHISGDGHICRQTTTGYSLNRDHTTGLWWRLIFVFVPELGNQCQLTMGGVDDGDTAQCGSLWRTNTLTLASIALLYCVVWELNLRMKFSILPSTDSASGIRRNFLIKSGNINKWCSIVLICNKCLIEVFVWEIF